MKRLLLSAACFATLISVAASDEYIEVEQCRIVPKQWARLATERIGVINLIEPEEGTTVVKGSTIVKLRDQVPLAAVKKAQKKIENDVEKRYAEKARDLAKHEYDVNVAANNDRIGTVPLTEIHRLRLAYDKAELQIEQSMHQLEIDKLDLEEAEAQLQSFYIKAPFSGEVTRRLKEVGEAVQQGETIIELKRIDVLKVEANIDLEVFQQHKIEQEADVIVAFTGEDRNLPGGKELYPGKLTFVDSGVQPVTRQVRVVAEIKNPKGELRSGLTATMRIYPNGFPKGIRIGLAN